MPAHLYLDGTTTTIHIPPYTLHTCETGLFIQRTTLQRSKTEVAKDMPV